jgi:glycosyltransferase involved in cell wall biosynthesis
MIVKNEMPVIRRCLASVKPWIDHWVIVDTGSEDGTQDVVRAFMADIPGELYQRPWRNFGANRTEALALAQAQGDFLLFIDADETLRVSPGFVWPNLDGHAYRFDCAYDTLRYQRNALVATALPWRWEGVIHEYLNSDSAHVWQHLVGPQIHVNHDGARARDAQTYLRDVAILEQALKEDPGNTRYVFLPSSKSARCRSVGRCSGALSATR